MDKKEIRFIDSQYNELFRISDGGAITVTYPNGKTESRVCGYIDEYHTYINGTCFHICQFAELMEQNKCTYAPSENTPKYTLETVSQEEFEYMFAPKEKNTERGCIGYIRADFGTGKEFHTNWFTETEGIKTEEFRAEVDEMINFFRDTSHTPVLKSRADMYNSIYMLKPTQYSGNSEIKGFKVQTEKHTYFLKCNPRLGDYNLYCYCYNNELLNKYKDLQFVKENYAEIDKDKFFKTSDGLMEVYYNPDADAGGQFVELTIYFEDIKDAAKECKKADDFFSHLEMVSKGALYDAGTGCFREQAEWFLEAKADFEGCSDKTMKAIKKYAGIEKSKADKEPER